MLVRELSRHLGFGRRDAQLQQMLAPPPGPPTYDASFPGLFFIASSEPQPTPALLVECSRRSAAQPPPPTLLLCHDAGEDLGSVRRLVAGILAETLRVDVLVFEYPNFGVSAAAARALPPADAAAACCRAALVAALYLTEVRCVPAARVAVVGKGLGAGPAAFVAALLSSSASSSAALPVALAKDPARRRSLPSSLLSSQEEQQQRQQSKLAGAVLVSAWAGARDLFGISKKAPRVRCPVLMVHGAQDALTPLAAARRLGTAFPRLAGVVEVADANGVDIFDHIDGFLEPLAQFLESAVDQSASYVAHLEMRQAPPEFANAPSVAVTRWLEAHGFGRHAQSFLAMGFYDLSSLKSMTVGDLDGMEITNPSKQRVLLALAAQATSLSADIPAVALDRRVHSGVVQWEVAMLGVQSESDPQWVGMEDIASASEKQQQRAWLSSIAAFEATRRGSDQSFSSSASEPPSPVIGATEACGPGTSSDHHSTHRRRRHHRSRTSGGPSPPSTNMVVIPPAVRVSTPSPQTLPPSVASPPPVVSAAPLLPPPLPLAAESGEENAFDPRTPRRKGSLTSSVDMLLQPQTTPRSKRALSREGSLPAVSVFAQQHSSPCRGRSDAVKDPLHVFVAEAMAGAPLAHRNAQLQVLFGEGVFGLSTLRALSQSPRWESVVAKLDPQLAIAISTAFSGAHCAEQPVIDLSEIHLVVDSPTSGRRSNP